MLYAVIATLAMFVACLEADAQAQIEVSVKTSRMENITGFLEPNYGPNGEFVIWDKKPPCDDQSYDIHGLIYGSLPSPDNITIFQNGSTVNMKENSYDAVRALLFHKVNIVLYKYRVRTIGPDVAVLGDSLIVEDLEPKEEPAPVQRESAEGYISVERGSVDLLTVLAEGKDDYYEVLRCAIDNETLVNTPLEQFVQVKGQWNNKDRFKVYVKFRFGSDMADIVSITPLK